MAKTAALDLVARVQKDFEASLEMPNSVPSKAVRVRLVSYPEDGLLPEQLLQQLNTP
jgi:hypothetical protein